ncbi:B- and T-lymphocyte attenuator isoform X2 [Aquarana catesbeiana]
MSISLRCPVYLCYPDHLPNVTWCRIAGEQCEHVEPDDRMTSWWEDTIENEAIHVVRIYPVQTNDSGLYKCTATFMAEQIVGRVLEVAIERISKPFVSLELNGDGFPECRASGRGSLANISWIPLSDDTNVTTTENPDNSWTVISTYGINDINATSVICLVSHSTFKEPWIWSISLTKYNTCEKCKKSVGCFWILAAFVVFVGSVIGLCVHTTLKIKLPRYKWSPTANPMCQWGLSRFRSCGRTEDPSSSMAPSGEEDNKVCTSDSREPE